MRVITLLGKVLTGDLGAGHIVNHRLTTCKTGVNEAVFFECIIYVRLHSCCIHKMKNDQNSTNMKKYLFLVMVIIGTASQSIAQNWNVPQLLDNSGNMVGESSSLIIVNGNPAMSYYDETAGDLKYIRATNAAGSAWGSPITVQSSNFVGEFTSMAIVSGNPAISYYDWTNGNLMYVRANDANGSTWGTPVTVVSSGDVGKYTSLVVVNGNPAIAYFDESNDDLEFVRATNTTGSTWGTPVVVQSTGTVGWFASMQIVNGNPAIAYYDVSNGDMEYVRATNNTGSTWGTPVIIQSTNTVGLYCSMEVVNGNPAVSFYDDSNDDLRFARANDANGATWGVPVTLDQNGDVGMYTSLKIIDGNPAIAYYDNTNNDVKYIRATNTSGTAWGSPATFETTGDVGEYACLQFVNGAPAISYHDDTNDDLRYVNLCNTWTGATSTDWHTASNWFFASVPISTEEVHIVDKSNDPLISSDVMVASLKIYSGGLITLSGSGTDFTITGTVDNAGVISLQNSTLILGGAVSGSGTITGGQNAKLTVTGNAGTLNFTNGSRTLESLVLGSSGSLTAATATLGTPLDIIAWGSVKIHGNSVLTSNGNLTLKSSSSGTAYVAEGRSTGGYITGNVTVERYVPGGRRAFRFFGHPFSHSIALSQILDDLDVTGSNGGNNGFTYQPGNPASAFWYNPATGNGSTVNDIGWTAFTHTDGTGANAWDRYEAARILVRGSKGQGIYAGAYTPAEVTLDMTGALNQGSQTVNFTKGANTPFALVSNPFHSPIDLNLTTRSVSLGANFIVWNANQGTRGGYTSVPFSSSYILPAGSSFVVTMTANSSITFPETCKSIGSPVGLLKTTAAKPAQVELKIEDSTIFWDRLLVMFDDSAKAEFDYGDARKMANPDISVYTFGSDDSLFSIDSRKHIDSQVIRVGLYVPPTLRKSYKITLGEFSMVLGTRIFLHDKYVNRMEEIVSGFEYWFDVTTDTASTGNNRFELVMEGKATTKPNNPTTNIAATTVKAKQATKLEVKLVPNPATTEAKLHYAGAEGKTIQVVITNIMGAIVAKQEVKAKLNGEVALPIQSLQTGMYMVEVTDGNTTKIEKLIKQ